jgi:glycine cleavage system H protein
MSDELTFMMGEFEAVFPTDRKYASTHMWGQQRGDHWRFGFTAYAVRLLQDVYFLEWDVEAGRELRDRQQMGAIESKKAESDLFSPLHGTVLKFNGVLLDDPSHINVDKYTDGWLFDMTGDGSGLMAADDYIVHLNSVWEITQKTIKGQLNQ